MPTDLANTTLAKHTINALRAHNITTVEALVELSPPELNGMEGFSRRRISEIRAFLAARGQKLRRDGEAPALNFDKPLRRFIVTRKSPREEPHPDDPERTHLVAEINGIMSAYYGPTTHRLVRCEVRAFSWKSASGLLRQWAWANRVRIHPYEYTDEGVIEGPNAQWNGVYNPVLEPTPQELD